MMRRITILLAMLLILGSSPAYSSERAQAPGSILLASGDTIQGVAGTATAITVTVWGTTVSSGIEVSQRLAKIQLAASAGIVYTAPNPVIVTSMVLNNGTGSPVTGIKLFTGGTTAADQFIGPLAMGIGWSCDITAWSSSCYDGNGAFQTASSGALTSIVGGTGINITGGTTINLNVPVLTANGGSGAITFTAHGLLIGEGTAAFGQTGLGTSTTVLHGNAAADPTYSSVVNADLNLSPTTCTNQFVTALSATGVPTCTTDTLASAQHANQGTTTTILHGNAAGNPSFASVVDADFSGALGLAHGGTNSNLSATGGTSQVLRQSSGGAAVTVSQLACSDLSTASTGCSTTVGTAATKNTGTTVIDPGTGTLEVNIPATTITATASKTYVATDRGKFWLRSNAGTAMTDTLPAPATAGNGWTITVYNIDATATNTISTPSGIIGNGGGSTFAMLAGRRTEFVSDGTNYYFIANNNNLIKPSGTIAVGHVGTFVDSTGVLLQDGGLLGAAAFQNTGTSGTTIPFLNGTNTWAGVNTFSSAPVMSGASITSATIANASLVNPATTVNGQTCTLGSTCTVASAAGTLTGSTLAAGVTASSMTSVGTLATLTVTAPITGSVTGNSGTATALSPGNTINGVTFTGASPITVAAAAGTLTGSTLATGVTASSLTSVGTLATLTVTAPIVGSITGNAATVTTNANLTGPVTSSGNATAVTAGAITNTMLATMNANTVKANITAGTASPTDVTLASFKTWLAIVSTDISDFAAAVRATVLAGLSTATNSVITAADSVLSALGKLQAQITANKTVYNAVGDFGMVGDQRVVFDGACSTGSNTHVTSATAAFVSADVGKRITLAGGGASAVVLAAVVSVINSGTDVTISGSTCGTTVSAKGLQLGTDNTTACNLMVSTINGLAYPGAKVIFPPSSTNRYACPVPLPFTKGAILEGQGAGINQDAGDYSKQGGAALVWWGTDNDGGVAFQGFVNFAAIVANNQPMPGVGMHDIWIDCRNADQNPCATAFRMVDVVGFDIRNFFAMDPLSAIDMATADMGSVTASTSRGIMSNIGARVLDNTLTPQAGVATAVTLTPTTIAAGSTGQVMTAALTQSVIVAAANGFATPGYFWFTGTNGSVYLMKCSTGGGTTTLGNCGVSTDGAAESPTLVTGANIVQASPNNGACMLFEGTASTNSNSMEVDMSRFSYGTNYGPACMELHNSDSNTFHQTVMNGGNPTNDGAINRVRRAGARFGASATGSIQASRNNAFYDGDPGSLNGGGVVAMGLSNAGALLTGASGPNYWFRYQVGNGVTLPIAEAVTASTTQAQVGPILEWTANGAYTQELGPNRPSVLSPSNALASTVATDVIIPGCLIKNPPQWAQAGAQIQFRIGMTKTAAGIPTQLFKIFYGASGAVGTDTAALATTAGAVATAAIDAQEITLNLLLPSTGASVTPTGMALRTGKNAAVGVGYGAMSATAPTMAAINTGTLQTFFYPAIRTSATGETNTIVSCEAKIVQAAAY